MGTQAAAEAGERWSPPHADERQTKMLPHEGLCASHAFAADAADAAAVTMSSVSCFRDKGNVSLVVPMLSHQETEPCPDIFLISFSSLSHLFLICCSWNMPGLIINTHKRLYSI
jgi:hypothetical protein